jgi:hypothetical protein
LVEAKKIEAGGYHDQQPHQVFIASK